MQEDVAARGTDALALSLPFDESALLRDNAAFIVDALSLKRFTVYAPADEVRFSLMACVCVYVLWC